jgi:hypothetical protein
MPTRCLLASSPAKAGIHRGLPATGRPVPLEHSRPSCRAPTLRFGSAALPTLRAGPRAARSRRDGARVSLVVRLTPVCKKGGLHRATLKRADAPSLSAGVSCLINGSHNQTRFCVFTCKVSHPMILVD